MNFGSEERDDSSDTSIVNQSDIFTSKAKITDEARISFSLHTLKDVSSLLQSTDVEDLPPTYEAATARPPISDNEIVKLNIVIQIVGSDVQPFLALGTNLKSHGHRVRIATHDVFHDFVQKAKLEFFPIGGDPASLMAYMVKNPGIIPRMSTVKAGEISRKRRMVADMLQGLWRSCVEEDPETRMPFIAETIIANPPSFAHVHCAQALSIPLHMVFTMPWTPTRQFAHPLANIQSSNMDERMANFLSYQVIETMTWQGLGDVINDWRVGTLGLDKLPLMTATTLMSDLSVPHTYCWSPAMVPKPRDWSKSIDVCGFFFRQPPDYVPPEYITNFLNNGTTPIYVGFGSITIDDPTELTRTIIEAVTTCGVRAIISRGWSNLGGGVSTPNVLFIDDCPHEWLFSQVSAVVHHGGSGTTACGLLKACPTLVVPFFGDQPFWGHMVARAGAGPSPIHHKSLTIANLSDAIHFCLSDAAKGAASKVAAAMKLEDGVANAVQSFHRNLNMPRLRCDIIPGQPAAWICRSKDLMKEVKLSAQAIALLNREKELQLKSLKPYRAHAFHVENERWDPLTATSAALLGTMVDFTSGLGKMVKAPVQVFHHSKGDGYDDKPGLRAANSAGKGGLQVAGSIVKGAFVEVPMALADGLSSVGNIGYGDSKHRGHIEDWKSGSIVGGKNFIRGFGEGLSEFVTKPYKGAKEEGAWGFTKGFASGSIGLVAKPGSGTLEATTVITYVTRDVIKLLTGTLAIFGLLAYPAQGIYRSLQHSLSPVEQTIMGSRLASDQYVVHHSPLTALQSEQALQAFREFKRRP